MKKAVANTAKTVTKGLIIKEQKVGEYDRLVTALTEDFGVIRAFVPGALKLKSKNLTSTGLLAYSSLSIYRSKDTYKITEAKSIEMFMKLRENIVDLSLAGYFCELLTHLCPTDEPSGEYLRLALNCLAFLCNKSRSVDFIKSVFELKLCDYAGYCPDLTQCNKCGESQISNVGFDVLGGVVYCEKCKNTKQTDLPNSVFTAMRHILYSEEKKLFSFKINEESEKILSEVTEWFLINQTDRNYKTLDFFKQMKG